MKTRFKTKQEFIREYGTGWRNPSWGAQRKHAWVSAMDPLFGLPWDELSPKYNLTPHPEVIDYDKNLSMGIAVSEHMLTTAPHPYEGKSFKIRVTPEESEMVQKKAFALGYNKEKNHKIHKTMSQLFFYKDWHMSWMGEDDYLYFNNHTIETELTPQQFMEGEVSQTKYEEDVERMSKYYTAGVDSYAKFRGSGKAKKPDAYITKAGSRDYVIKFWDGEDKRVRTGFMDEAHKYNLITPEDFKAKHSPQLKFKEWKVTVGDKSVKIGCQEFRKVDAERFTEFVTRCRSDHSAHSLSMDEVFDFIMDHKKELGL